MAMFEKKAPVVNHTHENGHTQTIETIIGSGATFQGTIITKTALRIDGIIQGDVQSTNTVIIGEDGIVRGTVNAGDMVTFKVRLQAGQNFNVRAGGIKFLYRSTR